MARLAILWHLHQPDYRDPSGGRPFMPWVRLHALRGYRDLVLETIETDAAVTLNLVPSLLDQLERYAAGGDDDHWVHTAALASEVDPVEVRRLPAGHPAMTRASPAYAALRARSDAGERLSVDELRDLQVWATLAWFGATARRDFPQLQALIARGRGFSEEDKRSMLAIGAEVLRELPSQLARLGNSAATVSTSPYYHPILPLLVDASSGRRANPAIPDDVAFRWPADARRQLVDARSRTADAVGRPVAGLWPSEGSVSPEVVALAGACGFRWLATDAGILERSDRSPRSDVPGGWDLGSGVVGFFRDTDLSDRIGFRYAEVRPERAVAELAAEVEARGGRDGLVVLALDGENPWETYADAGAALRRRLVEVLGPTLIGLDAAAERPTVGAVDRIHTGSWIGANLDIWVGHPEDRAGWRALGRARAAVEDAAPDAREAAMGHLLAAEGSDWFWWYGDEFHTVWADRFDALFRAHLAAAWRAIGREPPADLAAPIRAPRLPGGSAPVRFLELDASDPAALAGSLGWRGAGEVGFAEGAMAAGAALRRIRYGWTRGEAGRAGPLWVRVEARGDGFTASPAPDAVFAAPDGFVARYDGGAAALSFVGPDGSRWPAEGPVRLAPPDRPAMGWWEV